jgi:transcriptional regulator of aromatic amino acid metabolism
MNKIDYQNPSDLIDKDIFELLGIKNAPEEKKKEILGNMMATIQNRVIARVLDSLKEDEVKEFENLIASSDEAKIKEFLESRKINMTQIAAEESLLYKTEIINTVAAGGKTPKASDNK